MANVKDVSIKARLPFDYLTHLDPYDCATLARLTLAPSTGLNVASSPAGLVPNEHGGQTMMYDVKIEGTDAILSGTLVWLRDTLAAVPGASVEYAYERDVDNDRNWRVIESALAVSA